MQDQQIIQLIENLKGRRNYEEKKAAKLGFKSLYAYFENKITKEKESFEKKEKRIRRNKKQRRNNKKK